MSTTRNISRRGFIGVAAATVAASTALLSSTGCSSESSLSQADKHELPTDPAAGGKWVAAACWHNCGGRCVNKVMVKDGVVIRQKTDDSHEDSWEYPQMRGCVRGKTQQQQCFGADRILHPLKRKGWQPGGGENSDRENRGKDEWEVISWDEAISLACKEIKRISDEYGPTGFYAKSSDASINLMSGCVRGWDTTSHGTYTLNAPLIGLPSNDCGGENDRFDMKNAEYIIMWASNPTWSAAAWPINIWMNARDNGTKFYCIDPLYNASAQMLDAEWLPVRNGTDMSLMLATAYEMMRLDEEEGDVIDWDFMNRCTVGFDADHMPPDAEINENLKDYILGKYDGIEKTPEWAEEICGVPAAQITELAHVLSKKNKVMILHNFGLARCHGAEMIPQMLMCLGALGGHFGKSGHACSGAYHALAGNGGHTLVTSGSATTPKTSNPITTGVRQPQMYDIIVNGGGSCLDVSNAYATWHDPIPTTLGPVKCIYHTTDATLQTSHHQKQGIEAHRTVDFVLTRAQFMTTNARYSDIILPVTTEWETVGGFATYSSKEFISMYTQVTEPLGEAKTDQEIVKLLLTEYGIDPNLAYNTSEKQQFFEKIAGCTYRGEDGTNQTLVTITQDDIDEWGVEGTPQEGIVTIDEMIANGGYQYPRYEGDAESSYISYKEFVEDPEANPLKSNSGKLEIYCQKRYDLMKSFEFDNIDAYKPYPTYIVPVIGYETTYKDNDIEGEKGEYPYLMYNPHYMRRSHTVFDNCPWLRETWGNPVFINRSDAEKEGIEQGDTVLISTKWGQTLRRAAVLDILRPGVVGMPHGAWVDVDEETGIDQAGSDNYLLGNECDGMGVSGYNNKNCNIQKYTGTQLGNDCDLPMRTPEIATA